MSNPFYNCFCIDLTQFSNFDELKLFLESNEISCINPKDLWDAKTGDALGEPVLRVWIDSETFWAFAYATANGSGFFDGYADYLMNMDPLQFGQKIERKSRENSNEFDDDCLTIDEILDKISSKGMNSLSKKEIEILQSIKS